MLLVVFWGIGSQIIFTAHWERDSCNATAPPHSSSALVLSFRGIFIFWGACHLGGYYTTSFLLMFKIMKQLLKKQKLLVLGLQSCVPLSPASSRSLCVLVLLVPAVQELSWVIRTRVKAEEHGGCAGWCVCNMSTCVGNEFLEIPFVKIGRQRGTHLLGNPSLCYEAIMCYDYSSDKGKQSCCQLVSAGVFQHRRSPVCNSILLLVFVDWLGH